MDGKGSVYLNQSMTGWGRTNLARTCLQVVCEDHIVFVDWEGSDYLDSVDARLGSVLTHSRWQLACFLHLGHFRWKYHPSLVQFSLEQKWHYIPSIPSLVLVLGFMSSLLIPHNTHSPSLISLDLLGFLTTVLMYSRSPKLGAAIFARLCSFVC